jgi:hypothetical protein
MDQERVLDDFFKDNPRLEVFYEDLRDNLAAESRRIQDFLGVVYQELSPDTQKQRTKKKSELIANYDELKQKLLRGLSQQATWAKQEWLDFFDEE